MLYCSPASYCCDYNICGLLYSPSAAAASTTITPPPRNLPGVEVSSVERLNLLQLAPGGHMGRFVIFTKSAFDSLDKIYGESARHRHIHVYA